MGDVYDIKKGKDKLLSASDDGTVREWKLEGKREWFQELVCTSTLGLTADMNQSECELQLCNLSGEEEATKRRTFRGVRLVHLGAPPAPLAALWLTKVFSSFPAT